MPSDGTVSMTISHNSFEKLLHAAHNAHCSLHAKVCMVEAQSCVVFLGWLQFLVEMSNSHLLSYVSLVDYDVTWWTGDEY